MVIFHSYVSLPEGTTMVSWLMMVLVMLASHRPGWEGLRLDQGASHGPCG